VTELGSGGVKAAAKIVRELSGGPLKTRTKRAHDGEADAEAGPIDRTLSAEQLAEQKKHADKWNFNQSVIAAVDR
jgi:hypothetical protein